MTSYFDVGWSSGKTSGKKNNPDDQPLTDETNQAEIDAESARLLREQLADRKGGKK